MTRTEGRVFGFWTLTFLVIANMIGAGVFTTSGFTLAALGDPRMVLLAWLIGGVIALSGAISYGQLVCRIPVSGGEYVFLSQAAHPFAGFVAGWVSLLAGFSGAIAFAAVTLEAYLPSPLPPKSLALLVVLLGVLAHGLNRKAGTIAQNSAVLLKLVLLLAFVGVSAWAFLSGKWEGARSAPDAATESLPLLFGQALVWISLSYSGFNAGVYVAGEATSARTVARAMVVGTAVVTGIYLLLNAVFVLGPPAALVTGQADIAAVAAEWVGGEPFARLVRLVIALALFTSVLSMMMAGPRVYSRMAEDGLLPGVLVIRPGRTWPPVVLQAALAIVLILIGTVQSLLGYLGLTLSLCAAASVACLLWGKRDVRVRGWAILAPAVFVSATLLSAVLLVLRDPWQALGTVITVVLGVGAYGLKR
ncbi:MAG: amino acid permease [Verrucomicrobia bacterium]|nr:amino acid permease [Verrucomicrobiota bacterium]